MIGSRAALAGLFAAGVASLGCYKTINSVSIEPLKTTYPVSASGQYVDEIGDILTDEDYVIVKPFALHRTVEGPRHESSVTPLRLKRDLDEVVAQWNGDAVIDLKIEATAYDNGSHVSSSFFKAMGWSNVAGSVILFAAGAASSNQRGEVVMGVGAVSLGIGLACVLIGTAINAPTRWQLDVSGRVVRRATKTRPESE